MPDFGNGPYTWLKDCSDKSRYVGGNIGDFSGFAGDPQVSTELEQEFAKWIVLFDRKGHDPNFDWITFHSQVLALTQRLASELNDAYRYLYRKPVEDPDWKDNRTTEIQPITVQ